MIPIPLGTRFYKNRSLPVSAQNLVNMYVDILSPDSRSQVVCHLRPGKKLFKNVGAGPIRGMGELGGVLYVVSGTSLYSVSEDSTTTSIGTIPGNGRVSMATNLVNQLCIVNGTTTMYVYSVAGGLSSVSLSYAAYTVLHSDGYIIFDQSGRETFGITSNTDATSIDTTETGATNDKEDNVVAIHKAGTRVIVFCEKSMEGFYVSTNIDFPYAKDYGMSQEKGLLARWSLAKTNEISFWLGTDREIYQLYRTEYSLISDPAISYEIKQLTKVDDAEGHCYNINGHLFYVISFPTDNKSYCYDVMSKLWYQWGYLNNGIVERDRGRVSYEIYNKKFVGDYSNGNIYELDNKTYTDNGDEIRWEMTLPPIHKDFEPFRIGQMMISLEPGVGLSTGQGSDPQIYMSQSDDAKVWGPERSASIGKIGKYKNKAYFNRCGYTADQKFFRLSGSDPVKWAINGVYIDV